MSSPKSKFTTISAAERLMKSMEAAINNMIDVSNEIFELDTAPHKNAHIGGNQIIGFISIIIDNMDGKVLC